MSPVEDLSSALVDLAFPLNASSLPRDHRALLSAALTARLPWWGQVPGSGLHRINLVVGEAPLALLSGRTRLILRVPRERVRDTVSALAGVTLAVGTEPLQLGQPVVRELLPYRTLYAHFVAAEDADESAFMVSIDAELQALGVSCRPVCGRRQRVRRGPEHLTGFSLMLDGLSPQDALRVLQTGLGPHRALGCGLFVPHKSAAAVGA
jgi:CRISPR-associated protein Cas6